MPFFSEHPQVLLLVFVSTLLLFLVVDLGFLHRKPKAISTRSAAWQSLFWVLVSVLYGLLIYYYEYFDAYYGKPSVTKTFEYFSAYVTEKSLSIDNIFIILLIFKYFKIHDRYYHGVLFWGILGAIVFRGLFIFTGSWLVEQFHWILYIFGAFLVYSGVKVFLEGDAPEFDAEKNLLVRTVRRCFRISLKTEGGHFFIRENGKITMTILFLVLLLVEATDIVFAVDSIPAAFAITRDTFVIYTSNVFAIMGLRAMFFLVSGIIAKFYLLQKALAIILAFIGTKMLIEIFHIKIPINISFLVIVTTLGGALLLSFLLKNQTTSEDPSKTSE